MSVTPSPSDYKKQVCGFVAASKRQRCGNCTHAKEQGIFWSCQKNRFSVTVYAVCNDWKAVSKALNPVPECPKTENRTDGAAQGFSASERALAGGAK